MFTNAHKSFQKYDPEDVYDFYCVFNFRIRIRGAKTANNLLNDGSELPSRKSFTQFRDRRNYQLQVQGIQVISFLNTISTYVLCQNSLVSILGKVDST